MRPRFEVSRLRRVVRDPGVTLMDTAKTPGDIALTGPEGQTGGLLRLTERGEYILLSQRQVYCGAAFQWPWSDQWFRIVDDRLQRVPSGA